MPEEEKQQKRWKAHDYGGIKNFLQKPPEHWPDPAQPSGFTEIAGSNVEKHRWNKQLLYVVLPPQGFRRGVVYSEGFRECLGRRLGKSTNPKS
jgi:hypothetical protein